MTGRAQVESFGQLAWGENAAGEVRTPVERRVAGDEECIGNFGEEVPEVLVAGVGCWLSGLQRIRHYRCLRKIDQKSINLTLQHKSIDEIIADRLIS